MVKVPEQRVPRSDGMWLYLARKFMNSVGKEFLPFYPQP